MSSYSGEEAGNNLTTGQRPAIVHCDDFGVASRVGQREFIASD